jgi:nitrous oxidase accessory protein NosD
MFRSLKSLLNFGANKKFARKTNRFFKNLKMRFDTLEDRQAPAVSAFNTAPVLLIEMSAASDHAFISYNAVDGEVNVSNSTAGGSNLGSFSGITTIQVTDTGANAGQQVTFSTGAAFPQDVSLTGIEIARLFQRINGSVSGDAGTANVDDPGQIQDGIDAVATGGTVNVAAGTYAESLTVNKSVSLVGPNAGTAGYDLRGAEAIIDGASLEAVTVTAADVSIDGFTIDGNGADGSTGVYVIDQNNVEVSNNIIRNATYGAWYGSGSGTGAGGLVDANWITALTGTQTIGVIGYSDNYVSVTDNEMNGLDVGIFEQYMYAANGVGNDPNIISGNLITAALLGYGMNERGAGAATTELSNNEYTLTSGAGSVGVQLLNVFKADGITLTDETITGADTGVYAFINGGSASFTGGSLSGGATATTGVQLTNYLADFLTAASADGALSLSGVTISGYATGVLVEDNVLGAFGVSATLGAGNAISGGTTGLVLDGSGATLTGDTLSDVAFSGQSGNYITLSSGALDNVEIDGATATFDGDTGLTATTEENYAIEDKIAHAIDDSALGFVRVNSGHVYVTQLSGSIQRGVDAAVGGDTVNVAAGTFAEQVVITKALTVDGAGDATVVNPTDAQLTSIYTLGTQTGAFFNGMRLASIIQVSGVGAAGVTLKDLKLDGENITALPAGADWVSGLTYGETGGLLDNVTVEDTNRVVPATVRTYSIWLDAVGGADVAVEVTGSRARLYGRNGINARGNNISVDINQNVITGPGSVGPAQVPNGVLLIAGADGSVTGNTITANHFTGSSFLGSGVLLFSAGAGITVADNDIFDVDDAVLIAGTSSALVQNNHLHGNVKGVRLEAGATLNSITGNVLAANSLYGIDIGETSGAGNFAHDNSITGSPELVRNLLVGSTFDASSNYWGSADPAAVNAGIITGSVDFTPLLNNNEAIVDPTDGFQADHSLLTVHSLGGQTGAIGRIQEGVDALTAVGTLHVLTGNYNEAGLDNNVTTAGKAVTLAAGGASPGQVAIAGDLTLDGDDVLPIEINGNAAADFDSFTVSGLTTLGGSTLTLGGTWAPVAGNSYAIISGGTVTGSFGSVPTTLNGEPVTVDVSGTAVTINGTNATPTIAGTAGDDQFNAVVSAGNIQVFRNGVLILDAPLASLTSITIDALGETTSDKLAVQGDGTTIAVYTPSSTTAGAGTVAVDGVAINFIDFEPVDISGMASASVVSPANPTNTMVLDAGFDSATGTFPAIVVSGNTGLVLGFESAHLFNNTNVFLDTSATTGGPGSNTITVSTAIGGAGNLHGNTNLTLTTNANGSVTVDASLTITGALAVNSPTANLNANLSALTITGTATTVNVTDPVGANVGQIQDGINVAAATGATVNVADGTYNESNIAVNKDVTIDGQSQAGVIVGPAFQDSHIDSTFAPTVSNGFLLQSGGVTIQDLTVDGNADGAVTGDHNFRAGIITDHTLPLTYNGITVQNVLVQHTYRRGIQIFSNNGVKSTGHLVTLNTVSDVTLGPGIAWFDAEGEISFNNVSGVASGIESVEFAVSGGSVVTIKGNTLSNVDQGITLVVPGAGTVVGGPTAGDENTITTSGAFDAFTDVAITVRNATGDVTVQNNETTGTGTDAGLWLFGNSVAVEVTGNTFSTSAITTTGSGDGTGVFVSDDGSIFVDGNGNPVTNLAGAATLTGNTIDGFARGVDVASTGALLQGGPQAVSVTIDAGNSIENGTTGLRVDGALASISGATLSNLAFSGQGGDYITLLATGIGGVDGTAATFEGLTGGAATVAQNFDIEDKITHAIDIAGVGFVRVKAGNVFTTPTSFVSPATAADIQNAVDVAGNGDTIHVEGGSYAGSVTTSGKSVTLSAGPDASPAIVNVTGSLTLDSDDALNIDIAGPNPGTGYDQWNFTLSVVLGGATANLFFAPFSPLSGSFDVVTGSSVTGPFGTVNKTPANIPGAFTYPGTTATYTIAQPTTVYVDDTWALTAFGDDPDGAGPGNIFGYDAFATIQEGINAVAAGGTVNVLAGSYNENLTLGKQITLNGAQHGVDARGRVAAAESIVSPLVAGNTTLDLTTGSGASVIDGFTFSGGTALAIVRSTASAVNNNLQILNNRFSGFTGGAIFLDKPGTDITIDQNVLDGTSKTSGGGLMHLDTDTFNGFHLTNNDIINGVTGPGFFVDGNRNVATSTRSPLISGNKFNSNDVGINAGSRSLDGATISNNEFKDNDFDGFQGGPKDSLITQNTFSGNDRWGVSLTSFGNMTAGRGAINSTVSENFFSNNTGMATSGDILVSATMPVGNAATNTITGNSLTSPAALTYSGTETINASGNWWNTASNPEAASRFAGTGTATIDYTPWLNSGTDTDVGTAGFQGDFSVLNVDDDSAQSGATGRVQEGANLVTSGGAVNVLAGLYSESVIIGQSLDLVGPNAAIAGTGVRGAEATIVNAVSETVTVTAADVTIAGFTIDGNNIGGSTGVYVIDVNNVEVSNNIITQAIYGAWYGSSANTVGRTGGLVQDNLFQNLATASQSIGVIGFTSNYVSVVDNEMTGLDVGIFEQYMYEPNGAGNADNVISGNTITAVQLGYGMNERGTAAADTQLSSNVYTITGGPGSIGVQLLNVFKEDGITLTGETISGADTGVYAFISGGSATISGGSIEGPGTTGVLLTNYLADFLAPATGDGALTLDGVTITGHGTGVMVDDNALGAFAVHADITNNHIYDNTTGIRLTNSGSATVNDNNFEGGLSPDNGTDLRIDSTAGGITGGVLTGNTFAGATYIDQRSPQDLTALRVPFGTNTYNVAGVATTDDFAIENRVFHKVDNAASGLVTWAPTPLFVTPATTPTPTDNDYTRIKNAIEAAPDGGSVLLQGTFSWAEPFAAASWALGNDGLPGTADDYTITLPGDKNGVTVNAPGGLGSARIQGPGDLPLVDLEGVFFGIGTNGTNQDWTFSNLEIFDFDIGILFFAIADADAFDGTQIINNHFRVAEDEDTATDPSQNIAIHYGFGDSQLIGGNRIDLTAGASADSSSVGVQSSDTFGGASQIMDGLTITDNEVNVTGGAGTLGSIRGIWENSFTHGSDILVSINDFNGFTPTATTNVIAFRVTSHSSALTGDVVYSGNTVTGANIGFQWADVTPFDYAGAQPVQLTNNALDNVITGVLLRQSGSATLSQHSHVNASVLAGSVGVDVTSGSSASFVSGGAGNALSGLATGINVTGAGSTAVVAAVNFNGAVDNATDVAIDASAGAVTFGNNVSFAGDTFYIDVQTTQSINLAALTGIAFDLANNFRIEDRMHHRVDTDLPLTNGLVTWVAGNVYVTSAGADHSIQRGVDAATSGDTVNIETGTYVESVSTAGKAVALAPGSSPGQGQVNLTGSLTLDGDDDLVLEINGTNPATLFDNFVITGGVALGGADLTLTRGFAPAAGDTFTLIDNDAADPVTGTFTNLNGSPFFNGGSFTLGGLPFRLFVNGFGGNDVVLVYAGSATTLDPIPTSAVYGNAVTFTGKVSPSTAMGTIEIRSGATVLAVGTVGAGGTFSVSSATDSLGFPQAIPAGTWPNITAVYLGSSSFAPSQSAPSPSVLTVTRKQLTVTGITASTRVYDGTTNAQLDVSAAAPVGVLAGDAVTLDTSNAVGTFSDKHAGVNKTVFVSGLTITGADASNYTLVQPTTTATITPLGLTVTGITADDKVYNGNTSATIHTGGATLVGVIPPDVVNLNTSGAVGNFSDKNVGNDKTVTITGLTVDNPDYFVASATATADITPKAVTITGITASNKVYDGNTNAQLDTNSVTVSGVIPPDVVTADASNASGTFSDKHAGVNKTVTITGVTLTGPDAGNYTVTQPTATATITQAPLTVTGITADDKVYNGNTSATIHTGGATLVGVIPPDVVNLNTSGAVGNFSDKNVGNDKTVTITGLTVDNPDYFVASATATADITPKAVTITGITASNKVYDGNTNAQLDISSATVSGVIPPDNVTVDASNASGTFSDKHAGVNKTVTITGVTLAGPDAGNYTVTQPTATATISQAPLTVTGITANNKQYDGTTAATLNTAGATLVGVIPPDVVNLNTSGAVGNFDTPNVGTNKTVTISGLTVDNADYFVIQPTTTASITPATTTTTLVAAPQASTGGTLVTFTATIAPSPGNTGTVTFRDNGVPIPGGSNVAVSGGQAVFSTAGLTIGAHPITAVYSGSPNFAPSTSNVETVTVTGAATTTTLINNGPNPSTPAQAVSFTVNVAAPNPTNGETVELRDTSNGNALLGTGTLTGGTANITVPAGALSVGTHNLVAIYSGNSLNAGSTSNTIAQVVANAPQVLSVTPNGDIASLAGPQRSRVASLVVVFDSPVQLDPNAFALALHTNNVVFNGIAQPAGFGTLPATLNVSTTDNTTWVITFTGNTDPALPPADGFNSLKDGVYNLNIDATKVHPQGLPGVNMAANSTTVFHRLFGDINAPATAPVPGGTGFTAVVTSNDNLAFRNSFNNPAGYIAAFDYNGDGTINSGDNLQFRLRFNKPLTWTV